MAVDFDELEKGLDATLEPLLPSRITRQIAVKKLLAVVSSKVDEPETPSTKLTFWDKVWDGTKHFIYGLVLAGGSVFVVYQGWLTIPQAVAAAAAMEAGRKITKNNLKEQGKDYADLLDKLLTIVLALINIWRENKSKKK